MQDYPYVSSALNDLFSARRLTAERGFGIIHIVRGGAIRYANSRRPTLWIARETQRLAGGEFRMRVYLDNCCYNRPFDEQDDLRVVVETLAKLQIQALMRTGRIEYVWSDVLGLEVSRNPFVDRQERILDWMVGATRYVESTEEVVERGREIEDIGVKPKDALHLASAEKAECDWFITTDKGILKKVRRLGSMRVANPIDFAMEDDDDV